MMKSNKRERLMENIKGWDNIIEEMKDFRHAVEERMWEENKEKEENEKEEEVK